MTTLKASQRLACESPALSVAALTPDLRLRSLRCKESLSVDRLQCRPRLKHFSSPRDDSRYPHSVNACHISSRCTENVHPSRPSEPTKWHVMKRQALVGVASSAMAAVANLGTLVSQVQASEGSLPPTLTSLLIEAQRSVITSLHVTAEQISALADVKIDPSSALLSAQSSLSQVSSAQVATLHRAVSRMLFNSCGTRMAR